MVFGLAAHVSCTRRNLGASFVERRGDVAKAIWMHPAPWKHVVGKQNPAARMITEAAIYRPNRHRVSGGSKASTNDMLQP
jgi:hypothetical protein